MAIEQIWIVAFAGHRPGEGPGRTPANLSSCRELIQQTLRKLNDAANDQGGHIELLTGLAAGSDLEAAEVAEQMGIPVHVILPLPVDQFKADFAADPQSWARADRLIGVATAGDRGWTVRVTQGSLDRPGCYHELAVQMLESCDLLVAVWNGLEEQGIGGTGEAVAHARRMLLPVVVIDPATQRVIEGVSDWPIADPLVTQLDPFVPNADSETQSAVRNSSAEQIFAGLDKHATKLGSKFRGRLIFAMALHFLASLLAASSASFTPYMNYVAERAHASAATRAEGTPPLADEALEHGRGRISKVLTGIELGLVIGAWWIMWRAQRGHLLRDWRLSRFSTEVARGLNATARLLDPLDPIVTRHFPEWRRFALSFALDSHRSSAETPSFEERRNCYLAERLIDQRNHYSIKLPRAKRWSHHLGLIAKICTWAAPVFIGAAFFVKVVDVKHVVYQSWFLTLVCFWLPIVLPLAAGSALSFLVATDSARRAERYRLMIERLDLSARRLAGLKTPSAVSRVVATSEDIMIDELIEWYAASKNFGH